MNIGTFTFRTNNSLHKLTELLWIEMIYYLSLSRSKVFMNRIWIGYKVRDTAREGRNTIEDVLMTLKEDLSVLISNVKSFMVLKDPLIFILRSNTMEAIRQIEKKLLSPLSSLKPMV